MEHSVSNPAPVRHRGSRTRSQTASGFGVWGERQFLSERGVRGARPRGRLATDFVQVAELQRRAEPAVTPANLRPDYAAGTLTGELHRCLP